MAETTDPLLLELREAANVAPQHIAATLEEARDAIITFRARLASAEAERDRLREDAALLDALDVAPFALRTYVLEGRRHTVAHSAHTTATFSNARDAIRAASRAPSTGGTPP